MELLQETTSNIVLDFNLIIISIMQLLNIVINFAIKILAIYTMYLSVRALKKYLNDK